VARAAARIADLEAGRLPPLCAKTGEAADGSTKVEFTSSPSWTLILLLFGILPFLIAQHFATIRVVGILPMSDDALGRVRTFNRTVLALIVLSVVVLVAGLLATEFTVILIGLALLLAVILLMAVGSPFVLPTGQVTGEWVRLSFVHPRFADALDRWYGGS
jgi:fatty acid desaturase